MRGKKNEFTNTGLTQLEKQPPDILTHTQAPGTLEALDFVRMRYASGCNVPSIGDPTGVFVLPFGGVSAFEEMLNLLAVPSANWRTDNTQLYLNVFQKCSEFCGGNLQRELTTTFRVVCRTEDAKLYSDVYQKYCQGCEGVSRKGPNTISKGTSLAADVMRMDCESQKLMPTDAADIFQAYSALCSRDIGGRRSVNVRQTTTVSSYNFIHNNGKHSQHGPSTSLGGRNAHGNSKVNLTIGEATCSRGIGDHPSLNVRLTITIYNFNFIDDNDVRNTGPSTSLAGRNTRENREVGLTTGEATCSRGIRGRPLVNGKKSHNACLLQIPTPFSIAAVRSDFQGRQTISIIRRWLYDAISRGERDDVLAIFQKLGNLQFFITFTYNVNWPEIKRFMAQYPELTASDRADVVCPVFEQKIQSFVTFLKEERIFGNVT
ncbi:DNA helicase [Tanacetum coccineum]